MPDLTPAELRALRLKAQGMTAREIAPRLSTSERTVKNQLYAAYSKLGAENITEAYLAMGWLRVPPTDVCGWVGVCARNPDHRGHHGGFR